MNKFIFAALLAPLAGFTGQAQTLPVAAAGQEKHFLRAPDVLPGTVPEMRTAAYWTSRMTRPDEVVMRVGQIRKMNGDFIERMRHPERMDSLARQLILAKVAAYPGLFFSEPDLLRQTAAQRTGIIRLTIEAEIKYLRHTQYGNILGIQYSASELDRLEAEMSVDAVGDLPKAQTGITVEAADLRIVPLISPEYVGLADKNRGRWDVWSLDVVDIGTPIQVLHVSKSGGYLFVLTPNGFGWLPAEKIAIAGGDALDHYLTNSDFVVCTGDKVPFFGGPDGKFASGWLRMGDRVPLLGAGDRSAGGRGPYKIMVPVRQANGSLSLQTAWLRAGADVHAGYLSYTRRNVLVQSLKLLDNIYDWTGAWMGRNHATVLRDIFSCFGFRLPSCGELLSVYTEHPKWMSANTPRERQYREVLANEPLLTLQICSSGHSQLFLGNYDGVPIVYDTHGYNYTDTASGKSFDIRRECIETIALPDYFLKQDVVFVELK